MLALLRKLHRLLYFLSVFICFCICFPLLYLLSKNPIKNYAKIAWLRKWISIFGSYLVGIRYKVNFEEPIDWSEPYIICPNHTSILDITALTFLCPQQFSFMGKSELLGNPVTRIFFKTIDIPVNRESKISAFRAYKKGLEMLDRGKSLVVFPEGAIRDEYPPKLHKFKAGAFKMAQENKTTILPVIIHNAWEIMFDDGKLFGSSPGIVEISVLKPIRYHELLKDEHSNIESQVYQKMNSVWLDGYPKHRSNK